MVKVSYCCDCCGQEMDEKDYRAQVFFNKSALKIWNLQNMVLCEECAIKIDYALLKLKMDIQKVVE